MKKFCALLALAVMLALLPAAALALPRTVIYVLGVPDDVSEVQLLFADAPAPCVETKAGWGWSGPLRDPGGITGVSLLWPDGETYSAVRGDLEITKDACGTLYVRLTDVAAPQRYAVTYQYTGVVPPGAPALPAEKSYKAGAAVAVAAAPSFDGYEFSGWSVPELEVTDGTFSMPAHGVVLKGGFSKLYTVRYAYGGDVPAAAPPVPAPERHAQGDTVTAAAAPSSGDYDFSGWSTRDAELTAGVFSMPGGDVLLTGTFSPKPRCSVTYRYTGEVPAGAPALPAARSYKAGARVSVAAAPSLAGYVFSGWTTADAVVADGEFDMPAKAVVFTGAFTAAAPARYDVTYVYAGDVPAGAPAPPAAQS
ncbi:MAG: InlB B-repeat-containing protein [Oscillospiraceae bacterium]|nr:InlB B-repeat-containing protein [Oscillospiraceae bacterium]